MTQPGFDLFLTLDRLNADATYPFTAGRDGAVSAIVLCPVPFSILVHAAVSTPAFHMDCVSLCGIIGEFLNGSNTSILTFIPPTAGTTLPICIGSLKIDMSDGIGQGLNDRRVFQPSRKNRFPPLSQQPLLLAFLWFTNCACAIRSKRDAYVSIGIHAAASPSLTASAR